MIIFNFLKLPILMIVTFSIPQSICANGEDSLPDTASNNPIYQSFEDHIQKSSNRHDSKVTTLAENEKKKSFWCWCCSSSEDIIDPKQNPSQKNNDINVRIDDEKFSDGNSSDSDE